MAETTRTVVIRIEDASRVRRDAAPLSPLQVGPAGTIAGAALINQAAIDAVLLAQAAASVGQIGTTGSPIPRDIFATGPILTSREIIDFRDPTGSKARMTVTGYNAPSIDAPRVTDDVVRQANAVDRLRQPVVAGVPISSAEYSKQRSFLSDDVAQAKRVTPHISTAEALAISQAAGTNPPSRGGGNQLVPRRPTNLATPDHPTKALVSRGTFGVPVDRRSSAPPATGRSSLPPDRFDTRAAVQTRRSLFRASELKSAATQASAAFGLKIASTAGLYILAKEFNNVRDEVVRRHLENGEPIPANWIMDGYSNFIVKTSGALATGVAEAFIGISSFLNESMAYGDSDATMIRRAQYTSNSIFLVRNFFGADEADRASLAAAQDAHDQGLGQALENGVQQALEEAARAEAFLIQAVGFDPRTAEGLVDLKRADMKRIMIDQAVLKYSVQNPITPLEANASRFRRRSSQFIVLE